MTFTEAVTKNLRKYGTFKGRAGKSEYWWFALLAFLVEWPLVLSKSESGLIYRILAFIYFTATLFIIIPHMAVFTRRLHDIGRSGWNWMWILLPIIGWFRLIYLLAKRGEDGPNKYGDPDNEPFTPPNHRTKIVEEKPTDESDPAMAEEVKVEANG